MKNCIARIRFAMWVVCEKLGIKPPGVKSEWEDNDIWTQAKLLAFRSLRGNPNV